MKKILTSLLAVAVAAMAFTGCSKDEDEMRGEEPTLSVKLIAESEVANQTRTEFDAVTNNIIWSNGDKVSFYVNGVFKGQQDATTTDGGKTASFVVSGLTANQTNNIQGVYSAASDYHNDVKANSEVVAFGMKIPAMQNAVAGSYDKDADALVMDMLTLTPTATSEEISAQKVRFARPVAISKVTFKGVTPEAGETVSAAKFELLSTGKYLTGNYRFNPTTCTFVGADGKTAVADKNNIFHASAGQSVIVNYNNVPLTGDMFDAMFVTAPVILSAGDEIAFSFVTNKRKFTKKITLTKEVAFLNTKLNKLAVNLSGVTPEKPSSVFEMDAAGKFPKPVNPLTTNDRYLYNPDNSVAVILGEGSAFYTKANSNPGQYNVFKNSTLTVEGKEITKVVWSGALLKENSATGETQITTNCGNYSGEVWTATEPTHRVVFTTNENVYQWRISTVTVYYKDDTKAEFTPELAIEGHFTPFAATDVTEQTVNFSVVNNPQDIAPTLNTANLKHFSAEVRGNAIVAKPLAANTTSADIVETFEMKFGTITKSFELTHMAPGAAVATEMTIDLSTKNYAPKKPVPEIVPDTAPLSVVLAKSAGSSVPAYYSPAVRMYAKNTVTISGKTIVKVVFTTDNPKKADNKMLYNGQALNSVNNKTWTWEDPNGLSEVVFSIGGTSGNLPVKTITVTYK